jgi:hypothetical protein
MAILGIDHVVVIGEDMDRLAGQYRELGFAVTPGGKHPETGTENALIPFQDGSYIELLAYHEPRRGARRATLLARGGGLIEYMLASNAIELDLASARRHRLPYGAPEPGARLRPDGVEVAWLDGPVTDIGSGLPFLIQDVTAHEMRVPAGEACAHPNGATGIARLILAVSSIDNATLLYQSLLDGDAETARLTDEFVEAVFLSGRHRIVLRQPLVPGELRHHITRVGDGPFALELAGPEPQEFAPASAAGARIALVAT